MKIIQIKNRPLRAFVSTIAFLGMVVGRIIAVAIALAAAIAILTGVGAGVEALLGTTSESAPQFVVGLFFLLLIGTVFTGGFLIIAALRGSFRTIKKLYCGTFDP